VLIMAATTLSPAARYEPLPTFEDLQERLRRETARLHVKRECLAIAGADARALDGVQANLRALCVDFAAWRERHQEVTA
jgi:hypothetical protein